MSLIARSVPILTDASGDDVTTIRAAGLILRAVHVEVGTLDECDITITEEPTGTVILALTGVTEDARHVPVVAGSDADGAAVSGSALPVPVLDRIQITTANGGDTLTGRVVLLYER